ncbi:dihydrolipoamide acetyltransferase family protein [Roseitalea porphyridii]|uniref:Dihydrolipoamide acetyltransferase component of pyruvate dehydrogenase complex n=1 Tax=Roseitalea porphyridii TaxID=1852022 RepID=A0A4P6V3K7_9HYPH|nr:dihydrolipoamide acetyltransferase family protein [Roseitalea porphyridii]QBK32022.1 2-oxo acid dehydrogenase subunit E2 [Roseitalea porphyridii]
MGVFAMPSLGADMDAGTLVEWMIKPGDEVRRGDVVAVVETQKGAIEIETFEAGTVRELTADIGQKLPVGAPLAVILAEGEEAHEVAAPEPEVAEAAAPTAPSPPAKPEPPKARPVPAAAPPPGGVAASPAARKRAGELGLKLQDIAGSGPGGAVLLEDVDRAGAARPAQGPAETEKPSPTPEAAEKPSPMAEMRKAIAAAMSRSKREIPHFYVSQTIDLQPATAWLEATNAGRKPADRLLMGALFVRAGALAAAQVPTVNGHFTDIGFVNSESVHAGVAIALRGGGLVAPALFDAETKSLDAIMADMRDLVTRARAGRLRGSEMIKGTITISALGEIGAEAMTGVIFPPQVALVGIGAPQRRPFVVDEKVVPRETVTVVLSVDHRVCDGRQAAKFLAVFDELMQSPEAL